jgi:hypothetical protein
MLAHRVSQLVPPARSSATRRALPCIAETKCPSFPLPRAQSSDRGISLRSLPLAALAKTKNCHPEERLSRRRISTPAPCHHSRPSRFPFSIFHFLSSVFASHSPLATSHLFLLLFLLPLPTPAQNLDKPVFNVDDEVTSFAYAPDGRIVFSVRRMFKNKKYDMQRDDIFIAEPNGKRRRILEGLKFTHGDKPFTYQVESFTWSPNNHLIAVQLYTTTVDPEDEHQDNSRALLLLDDNGHMLKPRGDELVMEAEQPMWMRDNSGLVYLTEEISTRELFSLHFLSLAGGPVTNVFEGRTFASAVRIPGSNAAIAVERDTRMEGPPRIQRLDLLSQDNKEIATLESYAGGLSVSPSGTKIAYFLDREVLEIRDLENPDHIARMRVGLGVLQWNADESQIYIKRTIEKKSADLVSFRVPGLVAFRRGQVVPILEPEPRELLHGLAVREYALSTDGRYLAIVLPGKRNLQVFGF